MVGWRRRRCRGVGRRHAASSHWQGDRVVRVLHEPVRVVGLQPRRPLAAIRPGRPRSAGSALPSDPSPTPAAADSDSSGASRSRIQMSPLGDARTATSAAPATGSRATRSRRSVDICRQRVDRTSRARIELGVARRGEARSDSSSSTSCRRYQARRVVAGNVHGDDRDRRHRTRPAISGRPLLPQLGVPGVPVTGGRRTAVAARASGRRRHPAAERSNSCRLRVACIARRSDRARRSRQSLTSLAPARHAASAAPRSVAGSPSAMYSSSIARNGPLHLELAEDRVARPTPPGRGSRTSPAC